MTYTPALPNSEPLPVHPMVLGPIRVTRAAAELNYGVYIPWERCRLTYAYAVTTTVVATANFELDLELNAAAGTEMMSGTCLTAGSAVGDVAEFSVSSADACRNLGRHDTSRDLINIEIGESGNAAAADVWLFFEPDNG